MGRERGEGGQFTSNLGPGWTRIAPRKEEGFQVRGTWVQRELSRGIDKGSYQMELTGSCAICFILSSCIYVSCYCVNVTNKRIVFRL